MEQGMRGEAEVHIDAAPSAVYAVVTDVRRMGEWSPETVKGEWLDGATGPAVGARFKGTNKRGIARWSTTPTVVAADAGREFSFDVDGLVQWTYRFEAEGSGTLLIESFELLRDLPWHFRFAHRYIMRTRDRRADLERAMQTTLERVKRAVESAAVT